MKRLLLLPLLLTAPVLHGKERDAKRGTDSSLEKKPWESPRLSRAESSVKSVVGPDAESPLVLGTVAQWRAAAELRHPDLRVPESALSCAFRTALEVMRKESPEFFVANDWPVRLADRVGRSLKDSGPAHPPS